MIPEKRLLINSIFLSAALLCTSIGHAEVLFEEGFDDQPDWTSAMHSTDSTQRAREGYTIPDGWFSIRQDPAWAPSTGHPDKHETIEILASNQDKCRGGTGKCMVSWRDSYDPGWNRWNSESMLTKYFPEGFSQIYVEFWISFDPNWTRLTDGGHAGATSKIFRVSSWSGDGSEYGAFSDGNIGPIALWDHKLKPTYGMRNAIALRGGPHSDNYQFVEEDIPDVGHFITSGSLGDLNINYTTSLAGMAADGSDPQIPDKQNGGVLTGSSVNHNQVFGPGTEWTKMAFFVKMNSAPDVKDGVFRQWIDGQQIFVSTQIPWIRSSETRDENAKWNLVAIGGNDFFQTYPNSDRREEWYAIDDLVIRTDIPDYVDGAAVIPAAPNPPVSIDVR